MAVLKNKCITNLKSAQMLKANGGALSSIHCYYYACLQLSKHVLNAHCNINYKTQEDNCKVSSHGYIINNTAQNIREKLGYKVQVDYYTHMSKLKKNRETADYSTQVIGGRFAQKSESICFCVLDILKNGYNFTL